MPVANPADSRRRPPWSSTRRPAGPRRAHGTGIVRNLQVVADKDANTLLVIATAAEYSIIEQALRKLDIPQRQVMIEVTIAEVTLTDDLQFGVDWLFKGGAPSGTRLGRPPDRRPHQQARAIPPPALPTAADPPAAALAKGFTYIINNANFPGGIQAVLRLLDTYGNTKVVANPHVGGARQPEGHDQGRQPDPDQPADPRRAAPPTP